MKRKIKKECEIVLLYSIGVHDGERVLRDERESGDEKDNRGESKVKALVRLCNGRKSSCFWSCTQSEIEAANLQTKGAWRSVALLTVKPNPLSFCLTPFAFLPLWWCLKETEMGAWNNCCFALSYSSWGTCFLKYSFIAACLHKHTYSICSVKQTHYRWLWLHKILSYTFFCYQ